MTINHVAAEIDVSPNQSKGKSIDDRIVRKRKNKKRRKPAKRCTRSIHHRTNNPGQVGNVTCILPAVLYSQLIAVADELQIPVCQLLEQIIYTDLQLTSEDIARENVLWNIQEADAPLCTVSNKIAVTSIELLRGTARAKGTFIRTTLRILVRKWLGLLHDEESASN